MCPALDQLRFDTFIYHPELELELYPEPEPELELDVCENTTVMFMLLVTLLMVNVPSEPT